MEQTTEKVESVSGQLSTEVDKKRHVNSVPASRKQRAIRRRYPQNDLMRKRIEITEISIVEDVRFPRLTTMSSGWIPACAIKYV